MEESKDKNNSKTPGLPHSLPQEGIARTCFFVSKAIAVESWQTTIHSPDLITLSLTTTTNVIHIHNYYNPPSAHTSTELGTLSILPRALAMQGQHILLGDFNLHHPLWGGITSPTHHTLANHLIETATAANLNLALPRGTITRRRGNSKSTLDLIFTSQWIEERIINCGVSYELESSSDHLPILTTFDVTPIPILPQPPRPQWKKADWKKVNTTLQMKLRSIRTSQPSTKVELDAAVEQIQKAIQDTIQETIC